MSAETSQSQLNSSLQQQQVLSLNGLSSSQAHLLGLQAGVVIPPAGAVTGLQSSSSVIDESGGGVGSAKLKGFMGAMSELRVSAVLVITHRYNIIWSALIATTSHSASYIQNSMHSLCLQYGCGAIWYVNCLL